MDKDGGTRWSNRGDRAEEKQRSSDEEEPEEMQSRGDQDEADHKQPRADKDKKSPGLDPPGQNKKERRKRNDHKRRREETRHPPDWSIRDRTRSSAPPRTGSSGDKRRPNATDWIKQQEPPHPGLDQPVMQWGKQEAEAEVKVSSSHENMAMEKQCGSQEEEPVVMQ